MTDPDQHTVNESADKITVKTKVVRGNGTRDQDKLDVKVKGNDPEEVVDKVNAVQEKLRETADIARRTQPEDE
jgi:hypothetical protein